MKITTEAFESILELKPALLFQIILSLKFQFKIKKKLIKALSFLELRGLLSFLKRGLKENFYPGLNFLFVTILCGGSSSFP